MFALFRSTLAKPAARLAFLAFLATPAIAAPDLAQMEAPMLAEKVAAGELPPLERRLPAMPKVVDMSGSSREAGAYGGTWNMLMKDQKDIRMMTIFSYARLVGFNTDFDLEPDILASIEIEDDRVFTMHLRPGHRWSDGHPFTSEDFRYWYEDVALNEELSSGGFPPEMRPHGEGPSFEVIDETTVRYTWANPNPLFLPALAGPRPLEIMMPAHYLKQFHARYQDPDKLAKMVEEEGVKDWDSLHRRMARSYRPENPALPTLMPWRNMTEPPAERFVFERNPYFHRVDEHGRQLPYIDTVTLSMGSSSLIPAKTGTGESNLQARYIRFDDYTFLKASEKEKDYKVLLWETGQGSKIALYPNLNYEDPVWRDVFRDARFRRALSLAINREEINQAIYYGLARVSANTVLPESKLYKPEYANAWTSFDLKQANALLDDMGLDKRDGDGVRLLPDGRRAEIIVASAGESTEESDVLQLIHDTWLAAGIKIYPRSSQRDIFRRRVFAGQTMISVWPGYDNALPTADFSPNELAPTSQQQLQWPAWGLNTESSGENGIAPELPSAQRLLELYNQWLKAGTMNGKRAIWHEMLQIHADEVFSIGIVNGTLQPIVVSDHMHNVPEKGLYTYDPGAYFGIYQPDTFWLDQTSSNPS
ncbi:MAG: ABC transporter substrate-binding protein [Tepidamorphaceae bacterium]|nr:ABC transporter substrate-binding protein [Rhodobiaceae bacterium]MCC0048739.1 ABC transporter substrate-binding protein [Rhodobiaceae bacterium]